MNILQAISIAGFNILLGCFLGLMVTNIEIRKKQDKFKTYRQYVVRKLH